MNKEKEVEEMARTLCQNSWTCEECTCIKGRCTDLYLANKLNEAGYGNIEQAVKEFAEELREIILFNRSEISAYGSVVLDPLINKLIKEWFGEEV